MGVLANSEDTMKCRKLRHFIVTLLFDKIKSNIQGLEYFFIRKF